MEKVPSNGFPATSQFIQVSKDNHLYCVDQVRCQQRHETQELLRPQRIIDLNDKNANFRVRNPSY